MVNAKLALSLQDWCMQGRRIVRLEYSTYDPKEPEVKIWCYDYDAETGVHVTNSDQLPTDDELRVMRRKELEEKLSSLQPKTNQKEE